MWTNLVLVKELYYGLNEYLFIHFSVYARDNFLAILSEMFLPISFHS